MIDSFLAQLEDGCLLWQLDVDEFWKPDQVEDKRGADIAWRSGVQLLVDRRNADSGESPAY